MSGRAWVVVMTVLAASVLSACVFRDVARQQAQLDALCMLSGTVAMGRASDRPLVVLLIRKQGDGPTTLDSLRLADHFVREGSGRWGFATRPGSYGLAAFEDVNRDLVYQPDEPYLRVDFDNLIACPPGGRIENVVLTVPPDGRPRFEGTLDITEVQVRNAEEQMAVSIGQVTAVGEVISLDDPRFREEMAATGLWRPFDFLFEAGPGVYFLDEYDEERVPVLFVHGANGTPRNFQALIDALDRQHFQPWVYYYPSGVRLEAAASHLDQTIMKLERRLGFKKLLVVAHSMGGLVSRSFLIKHHDSHGRARIPALVTIATPWGGHDAAQIGVDHAPAVVRSWYDMAPGSPFLTGLFYTSADASAARRSLPDDLDHYLLFAFRRDSASFGASDDHVATVASQMRREAQDDAHRLYGFDESHMSVLTAGAAITLVNTILAEAAR